MKINQLLWFTTGTILLLNACQARSKTPGLKTAGPTATSVQVVLTSTLAATQPEPKIATPNPSPTQPVITSPALVEICSPLSGFDRTELETAIVNPYNPPAAGLDGPHQGVDFADLDPAAGYAREGRAVQALLPGRVASVIHDRFPYGNALMLETPLQDIPPSWLETINLPAVQPPQTPHPALTCPDLPLPDWNLENRSLYLLYAHMQQAPLLEPDDLVDCGQAIGAIGSSGNALNPHLHLEVRVGPSGARFDSLSHYEASARPQEMANYCAWRVRGIFQLVDPLMLIQQLP